MGKLEDEKETSHEEVDAQEILDRLERLEVETTNLSQDFRAIYRRLDDLEESVKTIIDSLTESE